LEANVKAAVGFQLLTPPDRAHWPTYITAQDALHHRMRADSVPLARWCGAVRAFARGAGPLAGNLHGRPCMPSDIFRFWIPRVESAALHSACVCETSSRALMECADRCLICFKDC
jgi:hypothetical protein